MELYMENVIHLRARVYSYLKVDLYEFEFNGYQFTLCSMKNHG